MKQKNKRTLSMGEWCNGGWYSLSGCQGVAALTYSMLVVLSLSHKLNNKQQPGGYPYGHKENNNRQIPKITMDHGALRWEQYLLYHHATHNPAPVQPSCSIPGVEWLNSSLVFPGLTCFTNMSAKDQRFLKEPVWRCSASSLQFV